MSDEQHKEIRRLSSDLIKKNPKVCQALLFSSNSVKEHVKKSKRSQALWQKLSTYLVVHRCDRSAPSRRHKKVVHF